MEVGELGRLLGRKTVEVEVLKHARAEEAAKVLRFKTSANKERGLTSQNDAASSEN
jgi:hypothetical protein